MTRRKFFRDEENPYDVVSQAPTFSSLSLTAMRDVSIASSQPSQPSGDLIRNIDESARRMNVSNSGYVSSSPVVYNGFSGQRLFLGDPLFVGDGTQSSMVVAIANNGNVNFGDAAATTKIAQSFIPFDSVGCVGVDVYLRKVATPVDTVTVGIQGDSGGFPDGSYIGSASMSGASISGSTTKYNFSFTATLSKLLPYHVVFERSGANDAVNYYQSGLNSNVYKYGLAETYDGAAWSSTAFGPATSDIALIIWGPPTVSGYCYRASAITNASLTSFIGFSRDYVEQNTNIPIDVGGFTASVSGISPGVPYYLGDTLGTIQATFPGTNTKKVGVGIDTTHIAIVGIT